MKVESSAVWCSQWIRDYLTAIVNFFVKILRFDKTLDGVVQYKSGLLITVNSIIHQTQTKNVF